jgi:pimeloyl-ACP methyl ester carboxylesterase
MKKLLIITIIAFIGNLNAFSQTSKIEYGNNPDAGHYVNVNGIKLYYEVYGEGEPLLLIHGNGGSIRGHSGKIEYFKNKYQVIAADSRAHGKTQDIGDSLTYKNMTSDINELLNHLKIDSCYIWGQSDGGIIGLRLAMDYPDKVKKMAVFGANLKPDTSAVHESIVNWVDETYKNTTDTYEKRLFDLLKFQPQIEFRELSGIKIPVLIMSGDRDAIKLEHSLEIFNHIENSNLFIMPGATHFGSYEKPDLFNLILEDFFSKPFSKKATTDIFK